MAAAGKDGDCGGRRQRWRDVGPLLGFPSTPLCGSLSAFYAVPCTHNPRGADSPLSLLELLHVYNFYFFSEGVLGDPTGLGEDPIEEGGNGFSAEGVKWFHLPPPSNLVSHPKLPQRKKKILEAAGRGALLRAPLKIFCTIGFEGQCAKVERKMSRSVAFAAHGCH